ncbi:MAG: diphosphomevalonate decarboxylase [Thermoplasmata archaeon]|nr:diphosphomevalonate decarboxylase [Thermoplasmata archaeon]
MPRSPPGVAACETAPNIALIKYWGIRDPERNLPYNSSISVTLDRLRSRTRVRFRPGLTADEFRLNGVRMGGGPLGDVRRFLDRVRDLSGVTDHAEVRSTNNFQTASGLASSASGFAALAGAATLAAGLDLSPRQLSQLARLGSGSACRSVFGGFVEWRRGTRPDGRDCYARPLFDEHHWPELVDVVAIVANAPTKVVRSASAMQASVRTSAEFARRQRELPARIDALRRALKNRNGPALFALIMEECDSFRRVCETTTPSLNYLTRTSREVLEAVRLENAVRGEAVAGYTHDAGAHVHVFTLRANATRVRARIQAIRGVSATHVLHAGPGPRILRVTRG